MENQNLQLELNKNLAKLSLNVTSLIEYQLGLQTKDEFVKTLLNNGVNLDFLIEKLTDNKTRNISSNSLFSGLADIDGILLDSGIESDLQNFEYYYQIASYSIHSLEKMVYSEYPDLTL